jgi:hypothetical protein
MTYIKIYPKKLTISPPVDGLKGHIEVLNQPLVGKVFYDIEQYGQLLKNNHFDILINSDNSIDTNWLIKPTKDHPEIKNFGAFLKSLNFYLFKKLKIQILPISEYHLVQQREINLQEVYFSLDHESKGKFIQRSVEPSNK